MDIFIQLFEFQYLLILVVALILGIFVGALPGLTPTMGVALTIPFTFSLGPTEGLILLGGIYCGSVFGGSIPAILFNVPGAPASVATTFDGYPMTRKGEARKALELSTISSVIGGLVGMILLVFFAPVLSEFSLRFGPTESFWIAIFGVTVIAAISDGEVSKNLLGGCVGIFLSFVGINTVTGTARFTFGMDSLIGGFHIVAVLIGLFALPQGLRMIEDLYLSDNQIRKPINQKKSSVIESFFDVLKKPKAVIVGSGVGAFVGMIPGAGGNIASILAYNEVKRFSKNKKAFGKGEKQGVIASESANNAMVGGSLIPLLTLGIPGSPTAAIFLGGLLIHGIWPGKNLFVDHADVAYTFIYSMVAAQILLLIVGLFMIRYMIRLVNIPIYFMVPIILSLSIIGAFSTQNSTFDVSTMVIFGIAMFILQKFRFSAAPIALGFILGPIAEEGLLQGLQIGGAKGSAIAHFFTGTWNILLFSFIMLTVLLSVLRSIKHRKCYSSWQDMVSKFVLTSSTGGWIIIGSIFLVFFLFISGMPFEQRFFPQVILSFMMILVSMEVLKSVRSEKEQPIKRSLSLIVLIGMVLIVSLSMSLIGFYFQVLFLMLIVPLFVYYKERSRVQLLNVGIVSVLFTIILYIIFSVFLKVPLPTLFY
ncbi:tripartite tricarboxylate transporter permease [Bacillus solitudinis]|uniref:tripartite tricarboxylate transporter permease n=1 Tax=Bacillus solitudinis TaxID=2014074 RepID=UPI000C236DA0|nr:tripartite tricarboxylate transporter permease [Bacillus solitudinis]